MTLSPISELLGPMMLTGWETAIPDHLGRSWEQPVFQAGLSWRCRHSTPSLKVQIRFLRSSAHRCAAVGPPDPVSNIRPIIYDDQPPEDSAHSKSSPTHPYSLDEFEGNPSDYQWRIERKRLDAYNHAFWTESNSRFEAGKRAVLDGLPEGATPEYREAALSEFYKRWLTQEQPRLREYSSEWNRRNFGEIMLAARAAIRRFRSRFRSQDRNTT